VPRGLVAGLPDLCPSRSGFGNPGGVAIP
jgi:hypothetical protein